MCSRRLLTLGGSIAATLLVAGSALAQLPKDDQKCIDQYNNKLRLVSQQAGKDYRTCIKNAGKGIAGADNCVTTDSPAKIAGKAQKVTDLFAPGGKCDPGFVTPPIVQGAATGISAHVDQVQALVRDIFGDPILDATVVSPAKDIAKCQDKAVKDAGKAFTEIIKNHRKCKKDAMKTGTVTDEATLDANCGSYAAINSSGKPGAKIQKMKDDVNSSCTTATPATDFPGACSGAGSTAALGDCLEARVRCRACFTLNAADGESINCDLFDNNAADGSCFIPINVGAHVCTLQNPASTIALGTQALPLTIHPSGTVNISCGTTDAMGKTACNCDVLSFSVLVITSIGDVCISPAPCPAGELDCDGGNSEDVDLVADHNIGACIDDVACQASCNAYCAGLGVAYQNINYGCEGVCQGGINHNMPCTGDSDCPGGQCPGQDPPTHPGVCGCACQGEGLGGASPAGSLACEIGTQINVELPSNGACGDPVTIALPPICGAVTTTTATGLVLDANNTPAKTIPPIGGVGVAPNVQNGVGIDCETAASSTLTGLKLVGHLGFFDSTLGDIFSANAFICQ